MRINLFHVLKTVLPTLLRLINKIKSNQINSNKKIKNKLFFFSCEACKKLTKEKLFHSLLHFIGL